MLYEDGIYAEFAVFEPRELEAIPYAPGRIVWKADGFDERMAQPGVRTPYKYALDWLLGEALTNLLIGMSRYRRGEKLAALRLIQISAVDQVIRLAPYIEPAADAARDPFAAERRFEQRFPGVGAHLRISCRATTAAPDQHGRSSPSSTRISRSIRRSNSAFWNYVQRGDLGGRP
ncbi:MAG: hypothetical protein U0521_14960 [Anaerolineae bacterium]